VSGRERGDGCDLPASKPAPRRVASHPDPLATARALVTRGLAGRPVRIFLFGSRARGDAAPFSDIDIALWAAAPLPRELLGRLRETLEESTVPVRVDLVDLRLADPAFRRAVLAHAVEWTG